MMNMSELIALRNRLVAVQANKQTFGAAEGYVTQLEAEVSLPDFNSLRGSVRHLLALVDTAIEARNQPKELRGRTEVAEIIDDAAFTEIVESPAPKRPRKARGRG